MLLEDSRPGRHPDDGAAPQPVDLLIALAAAVIQLLGTHVAARHHSDVQSLDAAAYLLLAIGPIALLGRRRFPVAVLAVVWTATMAYLAAGYPAGPIWVSLIIAFVTAVLRGHRRAAGASLVAGFFASGWLGPVFGTGRSPTLASSLAVAAWLLVLACLAELARFRRERAAAARASLEQEKLRRASDERMRIARELHDVLAHNISLINVQASTALHLIEKDPERAPIALSAIKDASKEALIELRSVLGILRQVDENTPRAPAPSVAHLDELVGRAEAAGIAVRVEVEGSPRPLPAGVALAGFRIVQEALTNVTRHARAASATVTVTYGRGEIAVRIDDDGSPPGSSSRRIPTSPGGGNGVAGMRERAEALGGRFEAGPRSDGGFRVRARLPAGDSA
jgi:signal transduction histidine kinase